MVGICTLFCTLHGKVATVSAGNNVLLKSMPVAKGAEQKKNSMKKRVGEKNLRDLTQVAIQHQYIIYITVDLKVLVLSVVCDDLLYAKMTFGES